MNRRTRRVLASLFLPTALALLLGVAVPPGADARDGPPAALPRSGAAVYHTACASCHGADGRGAPQHAVAFETELPDFTDCSFATREPDGDWAAVVADGGPARAFDRMMPAFGDALTEAEIQRALDHVRSFCRSRAWPRGDLNLPRPLVTEKAFVEDEAVLTAAVAVKRPSAVTHKLVYEHRLTPLGQIELIVPFGFLEAEAGGWRAGLGDVALGTKWALVHSLRAGSIFSLAAEVILPTGDEERGFGKGVTVVEPFLAFGQLLPADSFVQLQAGAEFSTEPEEAAHEIFWRGVLGISFSQGRSGRSWTPMVEVLGFRELEEEQATHWDLVPQLQVSLSTRQHVLACLGVRVPVDETETRRPQILLYLLWDWFDGGLFEGW
jgi:mono/diheme cytochrome c family protein